MLLTYAAIKETISSLNPDDTWSFAEIKRSETNYISHGYHRYPAKFIPQIVNKLIQEFTSKGELVLDPFGGCGTTLVEAKILGRKSVGYDINPVAKLITEAKITPINPNLLEKSFIKFLENYSKLKEENVSFNHSERINYWFDSNIQNELGKIFLSINEIKDLKIKKFYLCAFSHILKNCSRWLMDSIKPQIDPDKVLPNSLNVFLAHIKNMMSKNKEFYKLLASSNNLKTRTKMELRDSTKKFSLESNSIDLIITSPPYVTSYEYADLHQLILLWLGDSPGYSRWNKYAQQYKQLRGKFIGTKHVDKEIGKEFLGFFAHNIISQLFSNKKYSRSVSRYFFDMKKSINEMFRVLKPGKKICIVIGNTTLSGVEIKNAEVALEQMQEAGFVMKKIIKRKLSNKMITPYRDKKNGRFTSKLNPEKKRVYEYEYVLIGEKPKNLSN